MRRKGNAGVAVATVILALVFYVLSIGPVFFPLDRSIQGSKILDTVYAPLWWAEQRWPAAGRALWWYIGLFDDSGPPPEKPPPYRPGDEKALQFLGKPLP